MSLGERTEDSLQGEQRVRLTEGEWLSQGHAAITPSEGISESGKERSYGSDKRREQPTREEKGKVAFPRPHDLFWLKISVPSSEVIKLLK